ncbi:Shaker- potassium channel tsha2 [Clonorchis sinensis]|uniref:Shaker- potassium channel tsha2 n=1 Tax=Clonorchis sinensis TaxID=79923 RepID=A0A3R7CF38_CLOSI|nr:Shaker- potassium channel tsha2 [Clonorchis sinensis]
MFPLLLHCGLCYNALDHLCFMNVCFTYACESWIYLTGLENMIYLPSMMRPMSDSSSYTNSRGSLCEPLKETVHVTASLHNVLDSKDKALQSTSSIHHLPNYRSRQHHLQHYKRSHSRGGREPGIPFGVGIGITPCRLGFEKQDHPIPKECFNEQQNHVRVQVHSRLGVDPGSSWTLNQVESCQADRCSGISEAHSGSCPNLRTQRKAVMVEDHVKTRHSITTNEANSSSEYRSDQGTVNKTHSDFEIASKDTESCTSDVRLFSEKLLYFPHVHSRLRVQFKEGSHPSNAPVQVPLLEKVPMEGLLPFVCGRSTQNFYQNTPVVVEKKKKSIPRQNSMRRKMSHWGSWVKRSSSNIGELQRKKNERSHLWHSGGSVSFRKMNAHLDSASDYIKENSLAISEYLESESGYSQSVAAINQRVVLNVSGLKFETWSAVLESRPTTVLGDPEKRRPFWDSKRREYFFDRHRPSFEAIFNYYQYGGCLKRPAVVSDDIFLKELEFFQLEDDAIESYKKSEGYVPEVIVLPEISWKRTLWLLFEYPETSLSAFCVSVTSVLFTVISIILFCVETLPAYSTTHCEPGDRPNFLDPFFIIETMCTIWFTAELSIRFLSCPSRRSFLKDIKNLIDLAAIVPYYLTLTNVLITFSCEGAKSSASLGFLRVIRLIRVFKLTKHSSGLQVLVLTFKESVEGLSLFLVAFIVCILVFSSTIYYVEIDRKDSQIESIPDAFWWAVITMCTVGYGDKVPKGPLGKLVGSVCAVAGVLTLAIPVPIITENFNKFYAHKTGRGRR